MARARTSSVPLDRTTLNGSSSIIASAACARTSACSNSAPAPDRRPALALRRLCTSAASRALATTGLLVIPCRSSSAACAFSTACSRLARWVLGACGAWADAITGRPVTAPAAGKQSPGGSPGLGPRPRGRGGSRGPRGYRKPKPHGIRGRSSSYRRGDRNQRALPPDLAPNRNRLAGSSTVMTSRRVISFRAAI
jgi:hypothetical protein